MHCGVLVLITLATGVLSRPREAVSVCDLCCLLQAGHKIQPNLQFLQQIWIAGWVFFVFLAFDFCRFCVVIRFFHPRHNSQWPPTSKDFYTRSYPLHYFLILFLEKEPVFFPFSMFSAKQGNYWYHFYNVFGMTRSLTGDWNRDLRHLKPALYH